MTSVPSSTVEVEERHEDALEVSVSVTPFSELESLVAKALGVASLTLYEPLEMTDTLLKQFRENDSHDFWKRFPKIYPLFRTFAELTIKGWRIGNGSKLGAHMLLYDSEDSHSKWIAVCADTKRSVATLASLNAVIRTAETVRKKVLICSSSQQRQRYWQIARYKM